MLREGAGSWLTQDRAMCHGGEGGLYFSWPWAKPKAKTTQLVPVLSAWEHRFLQAPGALPVPSRDRVGSWDCSTRSWFTPAVVSDA